MTNFERITVSPEALADFFIDFDCTCVCYGWERNKGNCTDDNCIGNVGVIDWLNSEADE